MKIRTDYVSNSSSCSFFIELDSQASVDAFKESAKLFDMNEVCLDAYQGFDDVCRWDSYATSDDGIDQFVDGLKIGDWVKCDAGKDHDRRYMERFNKMVDVIGDSPVKFKIYEDPDAHMTYYGGLEFPE